MKISFMILSLLTLVFHSIFFLRAFTGRKKEFRPGSIDRVSRNIATALLLPTAISGSIVISHIFLFLLIWLPIAAIIFAAFNRTYIKKYPYLLPLINLVSLFFISLLSLVHFYDIK